VNTWLYLQLKAKAATRGLVLAQPFLAGSRGSEGTCRDAMAMVVGSELVWLPWVEVAVP
jgi:hypothetical protein